MTGEVYLVGGAVRDRLLGRPAGDRDWVVVGSTPQAMLDAGFRPVGADFPVFLHPESGEEFALARCERKQGRGYRGFEVFSDPSVTLEQDLLRRDFTINAIAEDASGRLIDPHGGVADIEARLIRHVSPAFVEDPVRLLRAARFLARFAPLGFRLADETAALLRQMVADGEVDHLVPERVWQELQRGLAEPRPSAMLDCLRESGALRVILPEVDALFGVEQRAEYHPEIDAGVHTGMVLDQCARLAPGDALIGFCGLTHDLGKALTPPEVRPKHPGHEHSGLAPLRRLCERLKVPRDYAEQAAVCCREHLNVHRLDELRDETVLKLIERCDGFRRPERITRLGMLCEADKRGRKGLANSPYPQRTELDRLHAAARSVQARDLDLQGLSGPQIAERLQRARVAAIRAARGG
ncbi:multifunctional CCA addition/repair protein [Lysobacter sp. CAU 1642]|uniref:Multifunctional CCA protein n=1 Tax=Pseudomarimonas salicorniae TaxID=2933270 RepID=A0ABT0GFR6_9GAMM|nr:multifunctional CCA addition/repair protein [Lysobacter sp. CAU 1642]MCK7593381.1 multifunctional CCA addition/repair protein [Lysobacter sp. CAU 1642]